MTTRSFVFLVSALSLAALSGCAVTDQSTTRLDAPMLAVSEPSVDAALIEDQAQALNRMADDLVRRSTIKGAQTGALVGCGVAVVTSNASRCVTSAAAGGLAGAAIGHVKGKRTVAKQVELVSANALVRSIRGMNGQMRDIKLSLPELLEEQDAELSDLKMRREAGALSEADYSSGVAAIRESRATIAHALSATIEQSKIARANLEDASQRGQSGLEWHLGATSALERDATSARSRITLL